MPTTSLPTKISRAGQAPQLRWIALAVLALLAGSPSARAVDVVRVIGGTRLSGTVISGSPNSIDLEQRGGDIASIPVEQIEAVQFDGEPREMTDARNLLARGRPVDAAAELEKIEPNAFDGAPPLVLEERDYLVAASKAISALQGVGEIKEAGGLAAGFLKKYPRSFHTYRMEEITGDLLAAIGNTKAAAAYYGKLAEGPAAMKVRAASAEGRMLLAAGDFNGAAAAFGKARGVPSPPAAGGDEAAQNAAEVVDAQKRMASVGLARAQVGLGKQDEAVATINQVIDAASPEDHDLLGPAYNALGEAEAARGKIPDALIAYLTVDLVYNSNPQAHAEALANLAELWEKSKQPERSRQARAMLKSSYPTSRWAKQAG